MRNPDTPNPIRPPRHAGHFSPGDWVMHRDRPDWGLGQVQSAVGSRVTVNFEHAGKVLVNALHVALQAADP